MENGIFVIFVRKRSLPRVSQPYRNSIVTMHGPEVFAVEKRGRARVAVRTPEGSLVRAIN
jgi:hypothetical protein